MNVCSLLLAGMLLFAYMVFSVYLIYHTKENRETGRFYIEVKGVNFWKNFVYTLAGAFIFLLFGTVAGILTLVLAVTFILVYPLIVLLTLIQGFFRE